MFNLFQPDHVLQYKMFRSHSAEWSMYCALCSKPRAVYTVKCTVCSVHCAVQSVECAVYRGHFLNVVFCDAVQCALCIVKCAVCSVQCAVCSRQCAVCGV